MPASPPYCRASDTWSPAGLPLEGIDVPPLAGRGCVELDRGHVVPQLLELVVPTRIGREDVEDDVEVIGEDPGSLLCSVGGARDQIDLVLHAPVHLVPDRDRLPRVAA